MVRHGLLRNLFWNKIIDNKKTKRKKLESQRITCAKQNGATFTLERKRHFA